MARETRKPELSACLDYDDNDNDEQGNLNPGWMNIENVQIIPGFKRFRLRQAIFKNHKNKI